MSRPSVATTNQPTTSSIGISSQARDQAETQRQHKRLHPIIVNSRHLPHAPHRPSQAERARRPGLDHALKRPLPTKAFALPPDFLLPYTDSPEALFITFPYSVARCHPPGLPLSCFLAALRLQTPCSLLCSGSSSDPSRFGCPKRDQPPPHLPHQHRLPLPPQDCSPAHVLLANLTLYTRLLYL